MKRLTVLMIVAACGGPKPRNTGVPLPPDRTPPEPVEATPAPKPEPKPEPKPVPAGPMEVAVPTPDFKVKLVSPGKGKREPLKYSAKAGDKQDVEVTMDFTVSQKLGDKSDAQTVPTLILAGSAETLAVAPDGNATFALTVATVDVKDAPGSVPAERFRPALASLPGMSISGQLGANGIAKALVLHVDKPDPQTKGALDLLAVTLPMWAVLPSEPVGIGAKWEVSAPGRLAEQVEVTQTTSYELIAHKGTTWTIKGTTKVTGTEQTMKDTKLSKIGGNGSLEITIENGALYQAQKSTLETRFTASEANAPAKPDPSNPSEMDLAIKVASSQTVRKVKDIVQPVKIEKVEKK
jgi:hypothetical protein